MFRAKVKFEDEALGKLITIVRPVAWVAIVGIPQVVLEVCRGDYFGFLIWMFMYIFLWPRFYKEEFRVSKVGLTSKRGIGRISDTLTMTWDDITSTQVTSTKEPLARGFTPMGAKLRVTYKKRFHRFLGGASSADVQTVAGWIEDLRGDSKSA